MKHESEREVKIEIDVLELGKRVRERRVGKALELQRKEERRGEREKQNKEEGKG